MVKKKKKQVEEAEVSQIDSIFEILSKAHDEATTLFLLLAAANKTVAHILGVDLVTVKDLMEDIAKE